MMPDPAQWARAGLLFLLLLLGMSALAGGYGLVAAYGVGGRRRWARTTLRG